jgi:transposase
MAQLFAFALLVQLAILLPSGLVAALPPHDFLGHACGAYCPSVKEVSVATSKTERGRFSSRKKMEAVLRVLRGEDLDLISREAGITAATLSEWREHFVTSGQAGLKSRAADGRDEELARLKALVGDLTMRLELSREAVSRLRAGAPLASGRSTR